MDERSYTLVGFLIVLLSLGIWISSSRAEVVKELRIESAPAGAEVFLKQGERETPIGKTPLTYKAEFHSEISILRMVFRKGGYQELLLEVSAKQDKVVANLAPRGIAANPTEHKDPELRAIQQRLNPLLNQTVPGMLEAKGPFDFDLAGPIRVARMDKKVFVVVPVALGSSKVSLKESGKARQEELLKAVWNQCGGSLAIPLARKLQGQAGIDGIVLDVAFNEQRYLFGVESRVETRVEMQCVPGNRMQQVFDACARRRMETYRDPSGIYSTRDAGCEGGYVTRPVYDPCASKIPVTKSEVKVDPRAGVTRDQARARYILPLALIGQGATAEKLYEKVGVQLTDAKGTQIMGKGNLPAAPPGPQTAAAGNVNSALFRAAIDGHAATVKLLLDKGANINARDKHDYTVLIFAASAGHAEVVKVLLDGGADLNAKNDLGLTALGAAKLFSHTEVVQLLEKAGAKE